MARHNFGILPQLKWKKRDVRFCLLSGPKQSRGFPPFFFGGRELGLMNCSNGMGSSHYSGDDSFNDGFFGRELLIVVCVLTL